MDSWKNNGYACVLSHIWMHVCSAGGALTLESDTGCTAVMTPLYSGQSALPSLPIYPQCDVRVPPFSIFRKRNSFSALFWPKFRLSKCKFSKFLFPRPLILEGKCVPWVPRPDPTFGNLCGTHPQKKKVEFPPPPGCVGPNNGSMVQHGTYQT